MRQGSRIPGTRAGQPGSQPRVLVRAMVNTPKPKAPVGWLTARPPSALSESVLDISTTRVTDDRDHPYLLVLYYSRNGQTAEMATQIGRGVARCQALARIRTVPPASPTAASLLPVPDAGHPMPPKPTWRVQVSPWVAWTRFEHGNPQALSGRHRRPWLNGKLLQTGRRLYLHRQPARGQETTLPTMMMRYCITAWYCGLPYSESASTRPPPRHTVWPLHWAGTGEQQALSDHETLRQAFGERSPDWP